MKTDKLFKNKLLYLLLVFVFALIVFLVGEYFVSGGLLQPRDVASRSAPARNLVYYGPPNSLAVLPLGSAADASGGLGPQHWAEGFSDGLIRRLAQMEQVHLIAPTSSFFFAGQQLSKRVMGERLRAAQLLDGSLSVDGGRLTLTLALTRSRDESVIWAGSFERPLSAFEALQSEVLAEVLGAMKIGPPPPPSRPSPATMAVLEAFLQGSRHLRSGTPEGFQRAVDDFNVATGQQPGYGPALAGLAEAQFALSPHAPGAEKMQQSARHALARALGAQPRPPEALALLSYVKRNLDWDWRAAYRAAAEGLEVLPGDTRLMNQASLALFSLGRFDEALPLLEASVSRDPLNLLTRVRQGLAHEFAGDFDEALQVYRQVAVLNPEFPGIHAYRARVKLLQDKPESALNESDQEAAAFWQRYARILALDALGRQQDSEALLQSMIAEHAASAAFQIAEIFSFRGDLPAAFEWLNKAFDQHDPGMEELVGNHFLAPLHGDPEWRDLLNRMGHKLD